MNTKQPEKQRPRIVAAEFLTIKQAAKLLNLPYWKLLRCVKEKLIPHYSLYNKRKLVTISDVLAAMEASCANGGHHE